MASLFMVSLLSPYRRPVFLQPVRLAAEFNALRLQRSRSYKIAELGRDVEIRPAGNRGNGLFALRDFEPDEIVVRYSGIYASARDLDDALDAGLTSGSYVAASDFPSSSPKYEDASGFASGFAYVGSSDDEGGGRIIE